MSKKFFASFLFLTLLLTASCAFAKVTEQQALNDPNIKPFVEVTKQQGAKYLPGRYAHVKDITSRANPSEKISSATSIVIEIGQYDSESSAYPSNFDVYGENLAPCYITLDTSVAVPVMRTYAADDESGEYEVVTEDFAVLMFEDENKYSWLLASTETGAFRIMIPLNEVFFPAKWYEGEWLGSDGSEIELDKEGEIEVDGKDFGTYRVSDNRIAVQTPDGQRDVIYCVPNLENHTLVMTFTSGPNGMGENAMVFVRDDDDDDDKPKTPTAPKFKPSKPKFKAPSKSSAPSESSTAPKFPEFPVKQPEASFDGTWQTYINGQQYVMQFQGNTYYSWMNGQPFEMGTFQRNGNVLSGEYTRAANGMTGQFTTKAVLSNDGKSLTLTDAYNSNAVMYLQRVQ